MSSLAPSFHCYQCMQSEVEEETSCRRWSVQSVAGCGEGIVARERMDPDARVLRDPWPMRVEITTAHQHDQQEAATSRSSSDGAATASTSASAPESTPAAGGLVLTMESAPNAAAASVPLLARLMALLAASMRPDATALDRRLGALVRRLAWEPLDVLRERDAPSADFLSAAARAFVAATEEDEEQAQATRAAAPPSEPDAERHAEADQTRAAHRALLVSLAERLLSALKLNSFMGREAAEATAAGSSGVERRHVLLLPLMAAVNHSCRPNATLRSDELRTIRVVKAGEQICISYLNDDDLRAEGAIRRDKLFHCWGFRCRCDRCMEEEEEASK